MIKPEKKYQFKKLMKVKKKNNKNKGWNYKKNQF